MQYVLLVYLENKIRKGVVISVGCHVSLDYQLGLTFFSSKFLIVMTMGPLSWQTVNIFRIRMTQREKLLSIGSNDI